MYDFIDLKLIQYIAEEPSLSAVATRAKMSLPAVSQRLSKLEGSLQAKLVIRAGRFGLTAEGQVFLAGAINMLSEAENVQSRIKMLRESREEALRVACSDPVLISHLPPVLKRLSEEKPHLRYHLEEMDSTKAHQLLGRSEVDVALMPMGIPRAEFQAVGYRTERICIIAPLVHPLGQEIRPVPIAAVERFDFIGLCGPSLHIERLCEQHGINLTYRTRVSSTEAQCLILAQSPNSLALTYESTARRHARTQPITVIRLKDEWAKVTFVAKTLRSNPPQSSHSRLIELLIDN